MKNSAKAEHPLQPTKAPCERKFTTEIVVWEGTTIRVKYEPNWLGGGNTAHLELHVLDPEGAPLPVTDTGYRSHFLCCGIVEECGGPSAYVRNWLDEAGRAPEWRRMVDRRRQLSLF